MLPVHVSGPEHLEHPKHQCVDKFKAKGIFSCSSPPPHIPLPTMGPADVASLQDWTAGRFLTLTTTFGEEINGQIITYDRASNILVIKEGASNDVTSRKVRLLKANYIEKLNYLGQGEDPLDPSKCFIDLAALQAREDVAVRQAEVEAERIGFGVTSEAQSIFDALSKTLPVRWDKTVIVVMNEVRVSNPYHPENVRGGTPAANDRVKKVLDFERKRLRV